MKILIVMRGFFPGKKYGGPPVSVDNFCSIMNNYRCYIITHNHDLFENSPYDSIVKGWNNRGNCKVLYLSDESYKHSVFDVVIKKIKPDLIYLQSIFDSSTISCLRLAKKYHIPVMLAPRGELCQGAINIKKYKKVPYVKLLHYLGLVSNIHFQSTSDEETEAIKNFFNCKMNRIHRLENIPSFPKELYSEKNKVSGEGRFVFISRIHPKKNLLSAINNFIGISGKVSFDIYGSIEDKSYWQKCQNAIKKLPHNIKCEYKGIVSHEKVHEVFSQYDAFVFPTLSENFGHVIVEAITTNCMVLLSKDTTPWNDLNNNGGYVIDLNDNDKWKKCIQKVIDMDLEEYTLNIKKLMNYTNNKLSYNEIRNEYLNLFSSLV